MKLVPPERHRRRDTAERCHERKKANVYNKPPSCDSRPDYPEKLLRYENWPLYRVAPVSRECYNKRTGPLILIRCFSSLRDILQKVIRANRQLSSKQNDALH